MTTPPHSFYFQEFYPFQDAVLRVINALDTGFYLTGGTAASRGYLHHRFSDDLDLFVNDNAAFGLWTDRIIQALVAQGTWHTAVQVRDTRFVRLSVTQATTVLKIELINDVPAHVGAIAHHPVLGRLDSAENILANKITALIGREEPKDLADVWGFLAGQRICPNNRAGHAHSKAAGLPSGCCRLYY
ncbi:MAG: nucleotidyl transferase AbiEii/AbiGii toxin family protein [Caldilineaceae bacterium]